MKHLRHLLSIATVCALAFTSAQAQNGELALKSNDRVTVSIGGIPDGEVAQIKGIYTVSDAGTINLLYIGEIRAAGMKPSSLQRSIEQTYISREIYTRPTVTVSIDEAATARMIYVISGCMKNGPVPYSPGMTILKAVGVAGGFSPYAKPSKTKLLRNGITSEVNLKDISANPSRDIKLQPEDQIIVPE